MKNRHICSVLLTFALLLAGCGGGDSASSNSSSSNSLTPTQIAALTAVEISLFSDQQIQDLGTDISYLSDEALQALTYGTNASHPTGQIQSITAAQIAALSPAQVRMIGAAGPGGAVTTSQIQYLNSGAWAALVSDPAQVSAITAAEVATLWDSEIVALGTNIQHLSDAALNALTPWTTFFPHDVGQIESITVSQIAALSPAQVRMIGAAGLGGSVTTSLIEWLNSGTWAALVSDPVQVAAITPAEIQNIWDDEIVAMGTNIKYLSNAALNALTPWTTSGPHSVGQIESITVSQIAALSPAQVRMIGAAGLGGSVTTSQIEWLNAGTWAALVSDPLQVAAITPAEVDTLRAEKTSAMGVNIQYLSDEALSSLSTFTCSATCSSGLEGLTVDQIGVLSPTQISAVGSTKPSALSGLAYLNIGAFSALSALQVATLTPTNVVGISAALLASLTTTTLAGFSATTAASFTATQTSLLSVAQHTACGC